MAKRYKLHLSDGTILVVDRDSLSTWLVDRKATVQIEGSKQWLPLREFIAAEREAEFRASPRRTAKTREELPLIPPPPKKSDKEAASSEPAKPALEPAPVTPPPPPREEPASWKPPTPAPPPREEPAPWNPPTPAPPPREEPLSWAQPTPPPPPRAEPAPWKPTTPAPPPREEPPPWAQPTPPPPPREEPPPWAQPERPPEQIERPRPASSEPFAGGPIGEPAGIEPLAGPVVTPRKTRSRPAAKPDDSIQPIPLVPLDETPATRAIPLAQEPARPDPHADAADAFADEDREGAGEAYRQDLPVIPLKPLADDERIRPPKWLADDAAREEDLDEGFAGQDLRHADVVFLRIMGAIGGFLSRLLDAAVRYERVQRSRRAAARGSSAGSRPAEPARPTEPPPSERSRSTEPAQALRAWQSLGEVWSAFVARIGAWRRTKTTDEPASLGQMLASAIPQPTHKPKAAATIAREAPAFDETFEESRAEDEPRRSAASARLDIPPPSRPANPPPPALKPPPALHDLPVLRLAEIPKTEEEETGDLYDGDYELPGGAKASLLSGLWRWSTRLVVAAAVIGGGIWAALTWKTWFPRAGEVGERALATIDQQVRSLETDKARQQVVQAGIEQLPQFAPETIRLVLSASTASAPDVLQVFQAANDATERGRASLTHAEGLELAALREELLSELPSAERDRVREYERSRAFGLALPSEDRAALALVARGARSLAPERLARLRTLLAKAIAAGLAPPSPSPTP